VSDRVDGTAGGPPEGTVDGALHVGTVAALAVYPVKSLAGRSVDAAEVRDAGLAGDRAWTVVDPGTGERVSPKAAPELAAVVATGDPTADTTTLTEVLGRPVRLVRADAPQAGAAAVHLVSRGAVRRAAEGEVPEGCSADDPRANVVLDLDTELDAGPDAGPESPDAAAGPGGDERGWVGRRLRLGEVELAVTRTPKHCLGVYAEVRTPGRVRVGDRVELLP
jgi:uncharacterized protein